SSTRSTGASASTSVRTSAIAPCGVTSWATTRRSGRPPTEIEEMRALVRTALADGAVGFTSSQLDLHVAHDGRGVPSNHATPDELVALASVLAEVGRGAIEFIPRTFLTGYSDADRELVLRMARASGRPVHLNTLTMMPHAPDGWSRSVEFADAAGADGLAVHP